MVLKAWYLGFYWPTYFFSF